MKNIAKKRTLYTISFTITLSQSTHKNLQIVYKTKYSIAPRILTPQNSNNLESERKIRANFVPESERCFRIRTPSMLFMYVCAYVSPVLGHPYASSFSSLSEAVVKASRVISAANFMLLCLFCVIFLYNNNLVYSPWVLKV